MPSFRIEYSFPPAMVIPALLLVQALALQIPPPRGFVNDFAGVLDSAAIVRIEATIREVREKTQGEIAVVTLADLGNREAGDVALQIGRQWGVGAKGEAGDPAKNLGVVVLLVPLKNHQRGTGRIFIATGRGAEGFLPDARVGRIRDAMTPYFATEDYGRGLETGVALLAQAFADEFHVSLTNAAAPPAAVPLAAPQARRTMPRAVVILIVIVILLIFLTARRAARTGRGRRRGGWWSGGGFGGWGGGGFGGGWGGGGGFSGGFGGFGGGGGFSGGGAGGRF
jgi:uncharacterized protein